MKRIAKSIICILLILSMILLIIPITSGNVTHGNTNISAFPATYRPFIQALINARPSWTFVPFNTGLNWNTVIANQTLPIAPGRALVPASSPALWRVPGATQGVEPGWAQASEAIVRYQMDPRNFLNETDVFQFEHLRFNANTHTESGTNGVLNGSFMHSSRGRVLENGRTYARTFVDIGRNINVSPFHLASRVRQEQGINGTSGLISGTYPGFHGFYNYFNIGATGTTTAQIITNGLTRARNEGWNTRVKSLTGGADVISRNFIQRGQDTLYLQKFNVVVESGRLYWGQYMTNIFAPQNEGRMVRNGYINSGNYNNSFVFRIPVYTNMPTAVSPIPGGSSIQPPNVPISETSLNGVEYRLVYNFEFYRENHPELQGALGSDARNYLIHFVNNGMNAAHVAHKDFDVRAYRARYPDLQRAFGDNWREYYMHYINSGFGEGRSGAPLDVPPPVVPPPPKEPQEPKLPEESKPPDAPNDPNNPVNIVNPDAIYSGNGINYAPVYNFNVYRDQNPDLQRVLGSEADQGAYLSHFVNFGMAEGRIAARNFNVRTYRTNYPDLDRAFGSDWQKYFEHYMNTGIGEGRTGY